MLALLLLSLGLAMDAVAVALVRGATGERSLLRAGEVGVIFGFAQGVMPLLGWALGAVLAGTIAAFDHWIAFGLLAFLGLRLIAQAFETETAAPLPSRRSHYRGLLIAAVATSIDAAAAGLTLPLLGYRVLLSCLTIGGITAVLCTASYVLGSRAQHRAETIAQVLGGIILIGLGVKILLEHLRPIAI